MSAAFLPTADQLLLLRAALWDGSAALDAFETWRSRVDYEKVLDGGSFRMLPLLQANMKRLGNRDPAVVRIAGVYRHSWCTVMQRMRLTATVIETLHAGGIPVLVAKGVPLALCYYDSPGLRPMSDVDFVIPRTQVLRALELLKTRGFQIENEIAAALFARSPRDVLAMNCALPLQDAGGFELDLHWRMIGECARAEADARYWKGALPFTVDGATALRPAPTHLLFHVIVHALKPDPLPPIRWVADAAMILRRDAAAIDWAEMAWLARAARVQQRLGLSIGYLSEAMRMELPAEALALAPAKPCWVERIERRAVQAAMARGPAPKPLWIESATMVARMAVSSWRGAVPGMAARWAGRRLLRLVRPA